MKRALHYIALFALTLIVSIDAMGVSRVGGGRIGDRRIGFEASFPRGYFETQDAGGGSIRLLGILHIGLNPETGLPAIEIHPMSKTHPEFSALDRPALAAELEGKGWEKLAHSNPCIDVRVRRNSTAITAIAAWGREKAIAVLAPRGRERDLRTLIDSIELSTGACSW